jgi:valyl-tRNA synthetase
MDTWATSSMSPQIVGQWLADPALYQRVFPFALRPQAHEIIRTWAFYTIVKSLYMFDALPWHEVAISGWGLAPEGAGKISKSRGGGPMTPDAMIGKYSADAVRYWAASTGFGKDTIISEERIQAGAKLATKLWNVARLSEHVLAGYTAPEASPALAPADRWLLARLRRLVERVTALLTEYDYATAKAETESFFWAALADNYLELAKMRLYDAADPVAEGARYTLRTALLTVLKLFAPFLPYVTEEVWSWWREGSIHTAPWPTAEELTSLLADNSTETARADQQTYSWATDLLFEVRKQRSEAKQPLKVPITMVTVKAEAAAVALMPIVDADLRAALRVQAFATSVGEPREIGVVGYETTTKSEV